MAGCDYDNPTKQDVYNDMVKAFNTLDNWLETPEGLTEPLPDIRYQLIEYAKKLREELSEVKNKPDNCTCSNYPMMEYSCPVCGDYLRDRR